ncbi:MAG: phytanoyl-CoA dioxygenase family protein [Candidatus Poribacteria bacterium]|nr:phytanoyl-CoA dioxygenase family protein [Candidatus Poribacteria bacterium]
MTDEEKFIFDLEGYLVIKNVLTPDEVAEMNAIIDQGNREGPPSLWGDPFKKLIDHPKTLPYLIELIGPKVRLDHDYAIFMTEGERRGRLHGGEDGGRPGGNEGDHWYKCRDGVIRNGLCVMTYFLTGAAEGDGGFACIPGSHKSNFSTGTVPDEVRRFERPAHYVVQPAVEAGDALFFTEAVIHGTMPWRATHERRSLLYKYSPGHSAWSGNFYDLSKYAELTEQQRQMLMPPSIGGRPDVIQEEPQ